MAEEIMMHIFVSWSGERSKAAAQGLRSLFEALFDDAVDVFVSEHINPGEAWTVRLGRELEESEFGVICLTQENADAPWLLFEAGAIANKIGRPLVVPYLVDKSSSTPGISSPLGQFQHIRADRDGTYRLIESINSRIRTPKRIERLVQFFAKWWPDLEQTLNDMQVGDPAAHSTQRSDRELLEAIWQRVEWLWQAQRGYRESVLYLADEELKHLQNLDRRPTMTYARSGALQKELRHLRNLGLIKNRWPIADLPTNFQLDQWLELTDKGRRYSRESGPPTESSPD